MIVIQVKSTNNKSAKNKSTNNKSTNNEYENPCKCHGNVFNIF